MLASLALLVNIVILFGLLVSWGNFVLTLPGIAGIILTIGLSIDANVLIYERLREELTAGKALRPALDGAYSKAFTSIFDANVTTLITSVILFTASPPAPVKGFAVTLTLGILASLFSALLVTRNGFAWATDRFGLTRNPHDALLREPAFRLHEQGAVLRRSASHHVIIGLSVAVFSLRGSKNFGIDFKGGDLTVMTTQQRLDVGAGARQPEAHRPAGGEHPGPSRRTASNTLTVRSTTEGTGTEGAAAASEDVPRRRRPAPGASTTRSARWWASNWRSSRWWRWAWACWAS